MVVLRRSPAGRDAAGNNPSLVAVLGFLLGLASTRRERAIVVALVAVPWGLGVLETGVFYLVLGAPQYVVGAAVAIPLFLYGESLARTDGASEIVSG